MRNWFILLGLLLVGVILPAPVLAVEADTGKIDGLIVNATSNSNVADQELTLKIYLQGNETDSKVTRSDAQGQFVFDGLSAKAGYSYDVTTNFQKADYTSDRVDFEDKVTTKSVKITVYDSTTSPQAINLDTVHTIVYVGQNNSLEVKSYALVNNPANLTYIGAKELAPDKRETLTFSLPNGAEETDYGLSLMSCCVIPNEGGFSDTMAVLPGTKEVVYTYKVPYDSGSYTLVQKFDFPITTYDLLVQGNNVNVASDKLIPVQPVTIEGQVFNRYSLKDTNGIIAGDALNINFAGLPQSSRQSLIGGLAGGLGAIFVGAAVFYYVRRKRMPQPVPVRVSGNLNQQKQRLLVEIARLDDEFATGGVAEDVYQLKRTEKKKQLLKLMQTMKEQKR